MNTDLGHSTGRVCYGVTITPNQFSARWRRLWWITDIGRHDGNVRRALIEAAGINAGEISSWQPNVSFQSLRAACAAIAKATSAERA